MEHAGTAVAAAVRALAVDLDRWGRGPIVIFAGPGNNGGDGFVAARRLPSPGPRSSSSSRRIGDRPKGHLGTQLGPDRGDAGIRIVHTPVARDVAMLGQGIDKAAVGRCAPRDRRARRPARTGPQHGRADPARIGRRHPGGRRRHPDRGRPVERGAVRPAVRADLTVTFHRPKTGLLTRRGARMRGRSWSPRSASRPARTVADQREVGPLQVVLVAAACVAIVAAAVVVTILLPDDLEASSTGRHWPSAC